MCKDYQRSWSFTSSAFAVECRWISPGGSGYSRPTLLDGAWIWLDCTSFYPSDYYHRVCPCLWQPAFWRSGRMLEGIHEASCRSWRGSVDVGRSGRTYSHEKRHQGISQHRERRWVSSYRWPGMGWYHWLRPSSHSGLLGGEGCILSCGCGRCQIDKG